jgi:uncharacterized protein with GYD domain
MPKYLIEVSYTVDGARGLAKDGGSKRLAAARTLMESLGGKIEAFYFAFGEHDAIVIADMPDNASAAAGALALAGSGAVTSKTTVLLTPQDMDQAVKKSGTYTPPGR